MSASAIDFDPQLEPFVCWLVTSAIVDIIGPDWLTVGVCGVGGPIGLTNDEEEWLVTGVTGTGDGDWPHGLLLRNISAKIGLR